MAKLLDFGLVRSHTAGDEANLTQEGAIAGTPAYMSPEQADGKRALDGRSDIYSLGALAYYLLTGRPPFVRPTSLQTLVAHLTDPPVPPDRLRADVPADVQAVVMALPGEGPEPALSGCAKSGKGAGRLSRRRTVDRRRRGRVVARPRRFCGRGEPGRGGPNDGALTRDPGADVSGRPARVHRLMEAP